MDFCLICLEKVSKEMMVKVSCGCSACGDCQRNWAISQINDEKTYVRCPFLQCGMMLSEIDAFLPQEFIERLMDNQVRRYLALNKSVRRCPKPGCGYAGFCVKASQRDFYCERCGECWVAEDESDLGVLKLKAGFEEGLNVAWKALFCKTCPGCEIFIEKNEGCRHIDCIMCSTDFCWFCKQSYKTHQQVQCSNDLSKTIYRFVVILTILIASSKLILSSSWAFAVFYWVICMPFWFLYLLFVKIFCFVIVYNLLRLFGLLLYSITVKLATLTIQGICAVPELLTILADNRLLAIGLISLIICYKLAKKVIH